MLSEYLEFNNEDYHQRFGGIARLYGIEGLRTLKNSHILVVGLGGVGSWAAESLARSGVGSITLVDLDDICITNTNRQLPAMDGLFGNLKVHAVKDRILAINPQCRVNAIEDFFIESSAEAILDTRYDYVIDAIDSLKNKGLLVEKCLAKNIPLIVTGGTAGKIDPTQIKIDDLGICENDSLVFRLRRKLRADGVVPKVALEGSSRKQNRQKFNVACVYSEENPVFPTSEGGTCHTPDADTNLKLDCESGMGSVSHVTALFGFAAAGFVVNTLTRPANC